MKKKSASEEKAVIKGCQKRVICLKGGKNDLFEEALLLLKDEEESPCDCDIVKEAERFLEEKMTGKTRPALSFGLAEVLFFLAGLLLSLFFWGVLQLFL